jgi:hypothetical protein
MVYTTEAFKGHLKSITPTGFSQVANKSTYERIFSDRREVISFSHNDYFPHSVYIKGVVVKTYFFAVETRMIEMFASSAVDNVFGDTGTISHVLLDVPGVNYNAFDIEIFDDVTFGQVAIELTKLVYNGAIPFFEKHKTLAAVFDETEKMPITQMSNFIGQPLPFRRLIIKKLCHDVQYEEYYRMILDFYNAEGEKEQVKLAQQLYGLLQRDP